MIINHLHGKGRASRSSLHHLTSHKQLTPETMAPRARLFLLVAVAALAYCSTSQAKIGKDDIVSQWVNETQAAVAKVGAQNQLSAKLYGLVGLAAYQALQAGGAPPPALAAFAGHTIVSNLFPWNQGKFDGLITKQLQGVSDADTNKAESIAVPIAVKLLRERIGDESTRWARFKPAPAGTAFAYQFAPRQTYSLYPQLTKTTPFFLTVKETDDIAFNKDNAKGPIFQPAKNDYAETFKAGAKDSKDRAQYDTDSAYFWADGANTSAITGHWLDIAREVLPPLSLEDSALFFARAGAAAYDASIIGWKLKYSTLHWRPITAYRAGYPGFTAVSTWEPLLATPAHPEYPSTHQVSVGAILEVLLRTLGRDDVAFSIGSEGTPWLTRSYKSLTSAAKEVGDSRVFGGLHFPSASDDGLAVGRLAAGKVIDRIKPLPGSKAAIRPAEQPAATAAEKGKAVTGRRLRA